MNMRKNKTAFLTKSAVIAALYVVLTEVSALLGISSGVIQFRLSEMFAVLPMFTPAAIPGLTIGCLISNIATGCLWQDVLFGTLATLIGAIGAHMLRRIWWLTPLPTVVANTLIIPFVLAYAYHAEEGIPFLMLTVGIGEVISAYVLGIALYFVLRKNARYIFKNIQK